jgi:bifunctional UDP-N-acetylglucosamine pyrophosphorylase/glucosamine-1-phosphate N-acetyltransferase
MSLSVVILAAGQGKRMKSALPKVLHAIAGKPMLAHVITAAQSLSPSQIVVIVGHGGEQVRGAFPQSDLTWAVQEPQRGTGHAVMQALPALPATGTTLVMYGDVPLITPSTLARLLRAAEGGNLAWLNMKVANPFGLGRIVRDAAGGMIAIANERDATPEQKQINEIWSGFVACPTAKLHEWLPRLGNNNAENEYYLTDILDMALRDNLPVTTCLADHEWEIAGINSKDQLASLERIYQMEYAKRLMAEGVTLMDPARVDVRGELTCDRDVSIDINCIFEGKVHLSAGVRIGANCLLRDCQIDARTEVLPFTSIDGAKIGADARIGPYARIRPDTTLADGVHIGNFVEVKASDIGIGSKANHLSYVGDTSVGQHVNIGAGTITCNYDGANKHRTRIEDHVHIGSDVQLIAPVTVGKGADIAAGTTVWKDVPAGGLTLNEKTQVRKPEWKRPVKTPK